MNKHILQQLQYKDLPTPILRTADTRAEKVARRIITDVRKGGEIALRKWAKKTGEVPVTGKLLLDKNDLLAALDRISEQDRIILQNMCARVFAFANAQINCIAPLDMLVPGGRAGHTLLPVAKVGCYVPGGRYPLPSSAIMTVCAARAAKVPFVICCGPQPADNTLAAAALAGADGFLQVGGAQGIAALVFGVGCERCDMVVGPGGRYVAAAKRLLFGLVGTDAPAGPSELLVLVDRVGDTSPNHQYKTARIVAADLLAQAEHDPVAMPLCICLEQSFADLLDVQITQQLESLPPSNKKVAAAALLHGWCLIANSESEAIAAANYMAPEHVEIFSERQDWWCQNLCQAGAIFLGKESAEVFGDYGAGPNHCLPTATAARFAAGLSPFTFIRARTWLHITDASALVAQTAQLARMEGLEAHARAAEARLTNVVSKK